VSFDRTIVIKDVHAVYKLVARRGLVHAWITAEDRGDSVRILCENVGVWHKKRTCPAADIEYPTCVTCMVRMLTWVSLRKMLEQLERRENT
jgi:hypothetical protein